MLHRTTRQQSTSHVPDAGISDGELLHERAVLLATVHAGGTAAVARILRRAREGDRAAQALTAGELLRALPATSWFGAHDLLSCAHVGDQERLGDLTSAQRGGLTHVLSRVG